MTTKTTTAPTQQQQQHGVKADIVVGGYLGDEGKGKFVGRVGLDYDAVLRVNASTNAGHCVSDGTNHYITRQLPSVFFPVKTDLVIAPGALLNLTALSEELDGRPDIPELQHRLKIASSVALLIPPYVERGQYGMSKVIGSTHQGTGTAVLARTARHALRLYDIHRVAILGLHREEVLDKLQLTCAQTFAGATSSPSAQEQEQVLDDLVMVFRKIQAKVGDFCVDYSCYLRRTLLNKKKILIEGCNGLLLDNLHGALPHVTSASTNIGAMMCGANIAPSHVNSIVIVIAAYSTCLGKRPFVTEMTSGEANHIFTHCNEVDVAEGNKRRIGWLDLPGIRKALVGSFGAVLHLNKLDVLSGLDKIKVCTHYDIQGTLHDIMPDSHYLAREATPKYVEFPGWKENITKAKSLYDLPEATRRYLDFIQEQLPDNRIASVGVGPANDCFFTISR